MTYDYYCDKCDKQWEESHPIADRDKPVGEACPCGKGGTVKRGVCAPSLSFEGSVSTVRKAGSGWNDVLKGIKKASGKESNIEHY
jgi:putative FmdB family regulatory protein